MKPWVRLCVLSCAVHATLFNCTLASTGGAPGACEAVPTGNSYWVDGQKHVNSANFSPDGKRIVTASYDRSAKVVEVATGKVITTINHGRSVYSANFSPDGRRIVTASGDGSVKVVEAATGKVITTINHGRSVYSANFSPDGRRIVTASGDGSVKVVEAATGKVITIINHGSWVDSVNFSPDGKRIVTAASDGSAKVVEAATGKVITIINHAGPVFSANFSPDGKRIVTVSSAGGAEVVEAATGKVITIINHRSRMRSANFSPDGKRIVTASDEGSAKVVEAATGNIITTINHESPVCSANFSPDGKRIVTVGGNGVRITSMQTSCVPGRLRAESSSVRESGGNCATCARGSAEAATVFLKNLPDTACKIDFDKALWDKATALPGGAKTIPFELAKLYLKRFQKPGGFDPEDHTHLEALLAILKSGMHKTEPSLVISAVRGVLYKSNQLYEYLLKKFPFILEIKNTPSDNCTTEKENRALSDKAVRHIDYLLYDKTKSLSSDWSGIGPLSGLLSRQQKDAFLHRITESISNRAVDTPEYSGVFQSKLYKFIYQTMAPIFGEKPKTLSDITFMRTQDGFKPMMLSTGAIDGDEEGKNKFWFYTKTLDAVGIPEAEKTKTVSYAWRSNGRKYEAQAVFKTGKTKDIIPSGDAPDYKSMWTDKSFSGLVVVGSNNVSSGTYMMNEYLEYYKSQGFSFGGKTKIQNLKHFIASEIGSGRADYFIKEAHSDGDEKNLFRVDNKAYFVKGEKKLPGGRRETITLVFPVDDGGGTTLIANSEFGSWIQEREKGGKGQLLYINNSCWSAKKAIYEIPEAASKLLLNIPALTMTHDFANYDTHATRLLLTAVRGGKNYDAIRGELSRNKEYKDRTNNVFLFPDEEDYKTNISQHVATPVKLKITMTENGRPYNLDVGR